MRCFWTITSPYFYTLLDTQNEFQWLSYIFSIFISSLLTRLITYILYVNINFCCIFLHWSHLTDCHSIFFKPHLISNILLKQSFPNDSYQINHQLQQKTKPSIAFRVFINHKMWNKSYYWIDNIMIYHLKFYYIQIYLPNKYLKSN